MNQSASEHLEVEARRVLDDNSCGLWTQPAPGRYPHQWLWDSAFTAIGLRHYAPERASTELTSLLRGQWQNGMLPHMIYAPGFRGAVDAFFWRLKPRAISGLSTSPITQPPVLAVAVELVAEKLGQEERKTFLKTMTPALIKYHEWLYRERTSDSSGLITLVHPWECGLDNTPPWMNTMKGLVEPRNPWKYLAARLGTNSSPERTTSSDVARMTNLAHILYKLKYDSAQMLLHSPVLIQDVSFNAILIAANASLVRIAEAAGVAISDELAAHMNATKKGIHELWDKDTNEYYSRNVKTGELIIDSTIATFIPLYAGVTTESQTKALLKKLDSPEQYQDNYAVPSISKSNPLYSNKRYWQGPMWVNTNWFIIRGLEAAGETEQAQKLTDQTLSAAAKSGMYEYFEPDTGTGRGAKDLSWSAALVLDLLAQAEK